MTVLSTDNDVFSPVCIVSDDPFSHFQGVLDRFSQIQPKLIFSVEAVVYNGKEHGHLEKLQRVVKGTRGSALGVCVHVCRFVPSRSPEFTDVHVCACMCTQRWGSPQEFWMYVPVYQERGCPRSPLGHTPSLTPQIVLGACADNSWGLTLSHPSFRTARPAARGADPLYPPKGEDRHFQDPQQVRSHHPPD